MVLEMFRDLARGTEKRYVGWSGLREKYVSLRQPQTWLWSRACFCDKCFFQSVVVGVGQ